MLKSDRLCWPAGNTGKSHAIILSKANGLLTGLLSAANVQGAPSDRARDRGAGYPDGGGCEESRDFHVEGLGKA